MKRVSLLCILCWGLLAVPIAGADWVVKNGWIDYCQHKVDTTQTPVDGMPDFCQRQSTWKNTSGQWTWCGPVAVANCLWWFDSKFEMVKCKTVPPGPAVRPNTVSDHYPLVYSIGGATSDDHRTANVIPFVNSLVAALPGGVPFMGTTSLQLKTMINNYLASAPINLWGHYVVTIVKRPTFEWIYAQVDSSQDLIVLLGFWQMNQTGTWGRFGGHWLTVAGVDTQLQTPKISFSDNAWDNAELGFAGVVWTGWLNPHPIPHGAGNHNDAGNVSHDWYDIGYSGSPGGVISPMSYGYEWADSMWYNFQGLNCPDSLYMYQVPYDPSRFVHTELEEVLMVCPNFDYGDLGEDYPTIDVESCGPAHPLTDKAWLGQSIDAEVQPRILNHDNLDDGVTFGPLPWTPGQMVTVQVQVNMGAHYAGEALFLNAWIYGNLDGDFDDGPNNPPYIPPEDDPMNCTEWVIQDQNTPVAGFYGYTFCVPGVGNHPISTIIRFRLTSQMVGRYGYGGYWGGGVSNGRGTYDIDWTLGEVEDYFFPYLILDPIDDLTIHVGGVGGPIELYWTAPVAGNYYIYSTTNPNNYGDPRHEPGWATETVLPCLPGPCLWITPFIDPGGYKNFVIVYETP